jgi:hypothetical protein
MALFSVAYEVKDINEGTGPNTGTGETVLNAFYKVDANFANITNFLRSDTVDFNNANVVGTLRTAVANVGNLFIGNVNSPIDFRSNLNVYANIVPGSPNQYDLGSSVYPFRNLYVGATVSTSTVATSSDAGLLLLHANIDVGAPEQPDVGVLGKFYKNSANSYAFFGYQDETSNFVYKVTNTNAANASIVANSRVYDGVYGNAQLGSLFISNATSATSNITGALLVRGGISSQNDIWAAGNVFSFGSRVLTTSDVAALGYPVFSGVGSLFAGNTVFATTTPSTSTVTGAVVVLGGIGVAGNVTAGNIYSNLVGQVITANQPFITGLGTVGNLTVSGTITTGQLQATSIGATGITATTINAGTLSGLANLVVSNQLVTNTINAVTVGNAGVTSYTGARYLSSGNIDITGGNLTISTDNTAMSFKTAGNLTNAILTATKSVNSFLQVAARNGSNGASASTDFIAYADRSDNLNGFIDMGIASTTFSDPTYGVTKAGDGYIFLNAPKYANTTPTGGNLVLATADGTVGDIVFAANGFVSGTEQGRFKTNDGLYLTGNLVATTGTIYQGEGAKTLEIDDYFFPGYVGLTNASAIFVGNTNAFVQLAMRNHDPGPAASTDLIAYSSNGDNDSGWIDLGITSENFADTTFGVTGPHDGYVFMSAPTGTSGNGSMFLSTSVNGAHNDIVFSTNGFNYGTERMRIVGVGRPGRPAGVEVNIATTATSTTTGALRVAGGMGLQGNLYVAGNVSIVGNLTFGGNGTQVSTSTLTVENPITFLANSNPANLQDIGMAGQYVLGASTFYTGLVRQATSGHWRLFERVSQRPTTTVNFNGVHAGLELGSANIANTTPSVSTTTGALVVAGGAGIAGNLFVGGTLTVSNLVSTSTTTLAVQDPMLYLTANVLFPWNYDTGFFSQSIGGPANTYVHHGMVRNVGSSEWTFFSNVKSEPGATINWSDTGIAYDTIKAGTILPGANLTYNLGSTTAWYNNIYGVAIQAKYADLAEHYQTDEEYEPGTVVIFGGSKEITVTYEFADTRVAGAISTNPAYLMNATEPGLPVALRGKVPVKVVGPVSKGDSLVTSDRAGYAVSVGRSRDHGQAVFAKSLEDNQEPGVKIITAVIV